MKSLYELTADAMRLAEALEQSSGEVTPELETWFDQTAGDTGVKLDNYLDLIEHLDMEEARCDQMLDQWKKRKQVRTASKERLKARLKQHLEATKQDKVTTATGRVIALQAAGGRPPLQIDDVNPREVASIFTRTFVEFDKDMIRDTLESGGTLPFARLLPRGTSLRVR
jgi:hypothetical protein